MKIPAITPNSPTPTTGGAGATQSYPNTQPPAIPGNKFNFQNTNPLRPGSAFYFPAILQNEAKKAAFFGAAQLFNLIPVQTPGSDFFNAFSADGGIDANGIQGDNPDKIGNLGLPVYGSITFGNTDINSTTGNKYTGIDGKIYNFNNLEVDCCLVTANQPTNVVKTKITGRPGSVKEFIGLADWEIQITLVYDESVLVSQRDFISNLWQIKQAQCSIPITNYYLNLLDIFYIVIDEMDFPQEMGKYSSQTVTIKASSDIPITQFLP